MLLPCRNNIMHIMLTLPTLVSSIRMLFYTRSLPVCCACTKLWLCIDGQWLDIELFSMHSSEDIKIRVVLTCHTQRSHFLEYVNSILKEVISKIILIVEKLWNMTHAASSWSHLRKPFLSLLTSFSHLLVPAELFSTLIVFLYFYLLNYS